MTPRRSAPATAAAFGSGLLFALGLGLGGMTDPARVQGFLDVAGRWDPTLAFVMAGALGTHALLRRVILSRRRTPVLAEAYSPITRVRVDGRLVAGAGLFGVGWGLVGLCPGPAVAALSTGAPFALAFFAAMLAGMLAVTLLERHQAAVGRAGNGAHAGRVPHSITPNAPRAPETKP